MLVSLTEDEAIESRKDDFSSVLRTTRAIFNTRRNLVNRVRKVVPSTIYTTVSSSPFTCYSKQNPGLHDGPREIIVASIKTIPSLSCKVCEEPWPSEIDVSICVFL